MKQYRKNKLMQKALKQYQYSNKEFLGDCYNNPSFEKVKAYNNCRKLFEEYEGVNFRIIGYNCHQFSVGFIGKYKGQNAFFYITKDYNRVCFLYE